MFRNGLIIADCGSICNVIAHYMQPASEVADGANATWHDDASTSICKLVK